MKLLVINGPNLNFLGIREKSVYGTENYDDLLRMIQEKAEAEGCQIEVFQSNHEGAIIDRIQDAYFDGTDAIVINPAAYTHTSIAIPDAIKAVGIPAVEVHLSDISKREAYRQISYVSDVAVKTIYGKGFEGYKEAIEYLEKSL